MKLNKKGFTLVELLAVVVVLALLMVVAANSIGSALDNSKKKALLTETEKLFNGITAEAQSLAILGDVNPEDVSKVFNGTDGDFTYEVNINKHGYIIYANVCYGKDYHVLLTTKEGEGIIIADDGYTTKMVLPTTPEGGDGECHKWTKGKKGVTGPNPHVPGLN